MGKQGKPNLKILKLLVLSLMRPFPCELQPAGELQGIMLLKVLANLRRYWDNFFEKNDMLCSGIFSPSRMAKSISIK